MGITPGSEDWCDIWLCNLLSRYFYASITIVRQSSEEGKGWGRDSCTESHMPFWEDGERFVGSLGARPVASRQPAGRRRYFKAPLHEDCTARAVVFRTILNARMMQVRHRSHATYSRQPRQVRKEATVTGSCVCSEVPVPDLFFSQRISSCPSDYQYLQALDDSLRKKRFGAHQQDVDSVHSAEPARRKG